VFTLRSRCLQRAAAPPFFVTTSAWADPTETCESAGAVVVRRSATDSGPIPLDHLRVRERNEEPQATIGPFMSSSGSSGVNPEVPNLETMEPDINVEDRDTRPRGPLRALIRGPGQMGAGSLLIRKAPRP
jgi:hypothetical protein